MNIKENLNKTFNIDGEGMSFIRILNYNNDTLEFQTLEYGFGEHGNPINDILQQEKKSLRFVDFEENYGDYLLDCEEYTGDEECQ